MIAALLAVSILPGPGVRVLNLREWQACMVSAPCAVLSDFDEDGATTLHDWQSIINGLSETARTMAYGCVRLEFPRLP